MFTGVTVHLELPSGLPTSILDDGHEGEQKGHTETSIRCKPFHTHFNSRSLRPDQALYGILQGFSWRYVGYDLGCAMFCIGDQSEDERLLVLMPEIEGFGKTRFSCK